MINLDEKTKTKILKIIKEEYKKQLCKYVNDEDLEKDFQDIHSLGDDNLSVNKIHIIQIIMELFGANVSAYNEEVKNMIVCYEEYLKEQEEQEEHEEQGEE